MFYALAAVAYNHAASVACFVFYGGHDWFTSTKGSTWCTRCIARRKP